MTAPSELVVFWTAADEDTMPAAMLAHTEKSREFSEGSRDGERVEYIRKDVAEDLIGMAEPLLMEALGNEQGETQVAEAKLAEAVEALRFLEIAATGAGVPHLQERKLLHETILKARAVLAEIEPGGK
ncbi:MAG: hypothetical protein EBR82_50105 [Caulobacteraceae bacterium]|nr:hypothetical protein [Caulobacteraceae bacterium]